MKVFIGYDSREQVAFQVLCYSIWKYASGPVTIAPVKLDQLPMKRTDTELCSTEFSYSRFLVPWMCNYEGFRAIHGLRYVGAG